MGVSAATDKEQINKMMPVMVDEIKKVCNEKITDEELLRVKTQIKAGILMSLESSSSVAERIARQQLIFGRYIPESEIVEKLEAVTKEDILKAAQKVFATKPTYTLVGNIDGHISYEDICQKLK